MLNREVFFTKRKPKFFGSSGGGCVYHSIMHSKIFDLTGDKEVPCNIIPFLFFGNVGAIT